MATYDSHRVSSLTGSTLCVFYTKLFQALPFIMHVENFAVVENTRFGVLWGPWCGSEPQNSLWKGGEATLN